MKNILSKAIVAVALLAACGGTATSQPAAEDASNTPGDAVTNDVGTPSPATDASSGDGFDDGPQACNMLTNIAPTVAIPNANSNPPAPQGGTIVDGIYAMTAATFYTGPEGPFGPSGVSAQITVQIQGSTVQIVSSEQSPKHANATIVRSNTTMTTTDTCPDSKVQVVGYTATPTSITVLIPTGSAPDGGAQTLVEIFTKR
jgi:hypothetical protein